jgi:hypothetical protein
MPARVHLGEGRHPDRQPPLAGGPRSVGCSGSLAPLLGWGGATPTVSPKGGYASSGALVAPPSRTRPPVSPPVAEAGGVAPQVPASLAGCGFG